jgi:hypothetical protein
MATSSSSARRGRRRPMPGAPGSAEPVNSSSRLTCSGIRRRAVIPLRRGTATFSGACWPGVSPPQGCTVDKFVAFLDLSGVDPVRTARGPLSNQGAAFILRRERDRGTQFPHRKVNHAERAHRNPARTVTGSSYALNGHCPQFPLIKKEIFTQSSESAQSIPHNCGRARIALPDRGVNADKRVTPPPFCKTEPCAERSG